MFDLMERNHQKISLIKIFNAEKIDGETLKKRKPIFFSMHKKRK